MAGLWMKQKWRAPTRTHYSCTACQHIAERKFLQVSLMVRNLSSGTRQKTVCTCKKHYWNIWSLAKFANTDKPNSQRDATIRLHLQHFLTAFFSKVQHERY